MANKCEVCGKELSTNSGLLQHYKDKHPDVKPPQIVVKREGSRKKSSVHRNGRSRARILTIVGVVVIILIAGTAIGVYYASGHGTTQDSPRSTTTSIASGINIGNLAPNFQILLANGTNANLTSFRGQTILLWFVTTWCSSCQQGAQMLSQQYYSQLLSRGVTILTVELYKDLNQPGPTITQFASQYGSGTAQPRWFFGAAPQGATYTYDPQAYLDVYYLLNSKGVILTEGVGLPNALPSLASNSY